MATKSKAGIPTNTPAYQMVYGNPSAQNNNNVNQQQYDYSNSEKKLSVANGTKKTGTQVTTNGYNGTSGFAYNYPTPLRNTKTVDYNYQDLINGRVNGSVTGGVGGSGGISGRANFQASDAYNQAMAYTNELLGKLSSGRTSYTDQINSLMDNINNRAAFSYDVDNDPLFQQYLASSMESGKTAMMDTMGQASALTGGYGSTYATAAANGAYNNFVQDAYNNLPEYYEAALNAYNTETSNLYNKLNMYNVADETEYNRLANAYQNNFAMANDMYGKEYNNYWDSLNYNTDVDKYNQDLAYKYASLAQDQAQYEANLAYKKDQDKLAQTQAQAQAQAEAATYKAPSETQYKNALSYYAEGGIEGVKKYVASLPEDIDVDAIMDYVMEYGDRKSKVTPEQNNEKYKLKQKF